MKHAPLILSLLLATSSQLSHAWDASGHRISARVAWDQLSPRAREKVSDLLSRHDASEHWLRSSRHYREQPDQDFIRFVEASTWADQIRHDSRYADDAGSSSRQTVRLPDRQRHKDWHYENRAVDKNTRDISSRDGQISRRLSLLIEQLGQPRASAREKAYALTWVIHLTADIHQPLHVASRYDRQGQSDAGGNGFAVIDPLNPKRQNTSLHAYWDRLPGQYTLKRRGLGEVAQDWQTTLPAQEVSQGNPRVWLEESLGIARTQVYPDQPVLDAAYRQRAAAISQRRLTEAGYRLAGLLNQIFGH